MSGSRFRKLLLISAVVLALLLLAVIVVRYQAVETARMLPKVLPEGVDLALSHIDYTHIENGVARWRLQAEQVEHQTSLRQLGIRQPRLNFHDEHGEEMGSMTAQTGEVGSDYRMVRVAGEVVIRSASGYTFYTEHAEYDHDRGMVSSSSPVRLVGERLEVTGQGMEIDLTTRRLRILANVKVVFEPEHVQ